MVSSFISIHSDLVEGEGNRAILDELIQRIGSIATAHEHLNRQADQGAGVDLALYLRDISEDFKASFIGLETKASIQVDLEHIFTDISKAVPLGLILNELLTNMLKYAFPGASGGMVSIGLHREGPGGLLIVEDTGVGFKADPSRQGGGFGIQLVHGLAEQLGGSAEVDSLPGHTVWTVHFQPD
jgi:two-component sensor histidine kinase